MGHLCLLLIFTLPLLTFILDQILQLILQGWTAFHGSLYYFSHEKKSWHQAENFCVSQGAHLASVTSQEEKVRAAGLGQSKGWSMFRDAQT